MECTACLRVGSGCLSTTVSRMTGQPWRRASRVVTDFIHSIRRVDPFLSPKFEICGIGGSRAFSDEVDTGSSENATKQKRSRAAQAGAHLVIAMRMHACKTFVAWTPMPKLPFAGCGGDLQESCSGHA